MKKYMEKYMEKYIEKYIVVTFIGIISICILNYVYWINNKKIESFTKKESIILLGDSILKNNSYVVKGQSVQDLLATKTTAHIFCFAVNDSTIKDAYKQIDLLPQHLNNKSTILFLSIGGNDILQGIDPLSSIFKEYMELVRLLKKRMEFSKIVLINLYYPTDDKYKKYYPSVKRWNELVGAFSQDENEHDGNIQLLDISILLTQSDDFTFDIEPSKIGGEKLANEIATISI